MRWERVALIVLCGGKSERMGQSKAQLDFDGEPMLTRILRRMAGPFTSTIVVAAPGQALPSLPPDVQVARDKVANRGPLQGLAEGLTASSQRAEWAFVCTTDVPFVSAAFARALGRQPIATTKSQAIAVHDGRFLHPLTALYHTTGGQVARDLLSAGERKPRLLLNRLEYTRCDLSALYEDEDLKRIDPKRLSLRNVNTPKELEAARHDAAHDPERPLP